MNHIPFDVKCLRRSKSFHLLLAALRMAFEAVPSAYTLSTIALGFSSLVCYVVPLSNIEPLPMHSLSSTDHDDRCLWRRPIGPRCDGEGVQLPFSHLEEHAAAAARPINRLTMDDGEGHLQPAPSVPRFADGLLQLRWHVRRAIRHHWFLSRCLLAPECRRIAFRWGAHFLAALPVVRLVASGSCA